MRNRRKYPRHWPKLIRERREAVGNRCQRCGVVHGTPRVSPWTGREWPVYLQCAHVHHDRENPEPDVIVVCPRCHWRYYRRRDQIPQWMLERMKHHKLIQVAYCQ